MTDCLTAGRRGSLDGFTATALPLRFLYFYDKAVAGRHAGAYALPSCL